MRNQMKTHSYKCLEFQCAECEFLGETEYTMEVHLGKTHGDIFECGLCDFAAKDKSMLNMYLFSCQIYVCNECDNRSQNLTDLKKHKEKEHTKQNINVTHVKQNRMKWMLTTTHLVIYSKKSKDLKLNSTRKIIQPILGLGEERQTCLSSDPSNGNCILIVFCHY